MSYKKILESAIKNSGCSKAEIARRCTEIEVPITKSYLCKLVSGKTAPPAPEKSRAIAKVCGIDEDLLVIEGFLETAPKEITSALQNLKFIVYSLTQNLGRDRLDSEKFESLRKDLNNQPIALFIKFLMTFEDTTIEKINNIKLSDNQISVTFNEPLSFLIEDDSMEPIIPKDSKVTYQEISSFKNGELYLVKVPNNDNLLVRKVLKENGKILLIPINNNFEIKILDENEVKILFKIAQVITKV